MTIGKDCVYFFPFLKFDIVVGLRTPSQSRRRFTFSQFLTIAATIISPHRIPNVRKNVCACCKQTDFCKLSTHNGCHYVIKYLHFPVDHNHRCDESLSAFSLSFSSSLSMLKSILC